MAVFSVTTWLPLVTAAALVVAGCSGAESRKAKHLAKGQTLLAAGKFEKARVEFRNALQIAPNDSEARFENGAVDEKLGNIREAAQFYQGAIDSNTDNVHARAALGRIYVFGGAPDKALETIGPAIARHPDEVSLLTVRAAARVQLKDTSDALADAQRAVALAPDDEDAIAVLAGLYRAGNDSAKAETLLKEAIKRKPGTVNLRLTLAQLDASADRKDEVEALLLDLVRIQPQVEAHRLRLAQFYARTDNVDASEHVLRDAIKALPEERDLKTSLVDLLATRRSREAAEKQLDAFIAADPKDYKLRFAQAQFYEQGKESAKAEAVYRAVIAAEGLEDPGLMARNRLAALRVQASDVPGAEQLIAEVLAKSPRDDDALILRGNLALAKHDPRGAISDLRAVLRDQPNAVGVMRALARAHLANGEPALAEETMRHAVEANPKDLAARLDLAQLLAQLGKPDQAEPVIEELVRQEPNDPQALDAQFRIALATKNLAAAQAAADALVGTQPKAARGYLYKGQLAETAMHPDEALRFYAQALELEPEAIEPLAATVRVLVAAHKTADALKKLDEAATRTPTAATANLKGEVLYSDHRISDAKQAFRAAIQFDPNWAVPYRNLAVAELNNQEGDAARATLQDGIGKVSQPEALESQLAALYQRTGKADEAMGVYEQELKRNPNSDFASNNLAMLLVTFRKDPVSLDRAKQLAARFAASSNPDFLDTYGWVLYKHGEANAAISVLQSALSKANDSPVSLYHLGMAEVLAGQPTEARDTLKRSLQSGRNFEGIDEAKATLDKLAKGAAPNAAPSKS